MGNHEVAGGGGGILRPFFLIPHTTKVVEVYRNQPVRLSVSPHVHSVALTVGWILFIVGTNDHQHDRVCRV